MAKLSFKDMIFKFLKKDEEAPANATGTAVAGTGDDSSTVVVKKKKELQKKLMTRMGITETIDRTIPDLEYPKDEIRERADQLKELALQSEQFKVRFTDPANKKKFHIIYRSKGEAEAKMAQLKRDGVKQIEIVSEDLDAQPQDRDVKKIKGTQPKKYYKKMSKDDKEKRAKHFTTRDTSKNDNRPAPGDKDAKTKPSIHTKKFKQMYGEDLLDEKIKGIENKAKKSGMPYGILKKVYDRGMAAWRGGHRPGATQQQWAFARVNSFVTKSSGTWGGADKDLAKKVRGSK
jgi:sulfite reductase alpha subunit-like flavoprotein